MIIKDIISQVWTKTKDSFLSKGGGTLSGDLKIITPSWPALFLAPQGSGQEGAKLQVRGATDETGLIFTISNFTDIWGETTGRIFWFQNQKSTDAAHAFEFTEKDNGVWGDRYTFIHTGSDPVETNNALVSWSLGAGTPLSSGADLNDIWEVGNYRCGTNAEVAKLTNCPTTIAFTMKVYSSVGNSVIKEPSTAWQYGIQEVHDMNNNMWLRYFTNNGNAAFTFRNWIKIVTATDGKITGYTVQGAVYN